MQAYIHG